MTRHLLLSLGLLLAGDWLAGSAAAQSFCDPTLLDGSESPLAYRQRGDRCEGIYAQPVGKLNLEIRSFMAAFEAFDPATAPELTVRWSLPPGAGDRKVHLRALSVKPRTYYRMDTTVAATEGVYHWPGELLAALGLTREDLGVVGWMENVAGASAAREVYLPLRIGDSAGAPADGGYQVSLVPSTRLEEVVLTLAKLDEAGRAVATLRRQEALGYGYYPSNLPTTFTLDGLDGEGLYQLLISARVRNGLPATEVLTFYHPGR